VEAFRWPWQKKPEAPKPPSDDSAPPSGDEEPPAPSGISVPSADDIKSAIDDKRAAIKAALEDVIKDHHPRVKKAVAEAMASGKEDAKQALQDALSSLPDMPLKDEVLKALDGASSEDVEGAVKEVADEEADDQSLGPAARKMFDGLKAKAAELAGAGKEEAAEAQGEERSEEAGSATVEAFRWPWQKKPEAPKPPSDDSAPPSGDEEPPAPSGISVPSADDIKSAIDDKRAAIKAALEDVIKDHHPRVKKAVAEAMASGKEDAKQALQDALSSLPDMPLKDEVLKALDGASSEDVEGAVKEVADEEADDQSLGPAARKMFDGLKAKAAELAGAGKEESSTDEALPVLGTKGVPAQAHHAVGPTGAVPAVAIALVLAAVSLAALAIAQVVRGGHAAYRARRARAGDYVDAKDAMLLGGDAMSRSEPLAEA